VVVFDRDGKKFTTNIANIAVEHDFNRVEVEGHPPDVFEQAMAKFEAELSPALARILEAGNLRDEKDRGILLDFIAHISVRNPRYRETFRKFNEEIMTKIMELATATKERWEGELEKMRRAGRPVSENLSYEEMREFVKKKQFRIELRNEFQIGTEMGGVDAVLPTLHERKWVTHTAPKESSGFITSDHPVCLTFSDAKMRGGFYGPGHGLTGTEVIFPIGQRLAMVGAFELKDGERQLDEDGVSGVNGALVAFAERQVYAHDVDFTYSREYSEKPRRGVELVNDAIFRRKNR
jgi:Protein of unknown function (DUF4238)